MRFAGMGDAVVAELTGIVLAGGRSSRMGRDKARLAWSDGQTFLDRAIAVLEQAGCSRVIVSGDRPGYEHVPDRWPQQGPLGGIASVLHTRPELSGRLLIVPVDMPQLEPGQLRRLVEAGDQGDGAIFAGTPLPMLLAANRRARLRVAALLESGRLKLHGLVNELGMTAVEPGAGVQLGNINTPADFDAGRSD